MAIALWFNKSDQYKTAVNTNRICSSK